MDEIRLGSCLAKPYSKYILNNEYKNNHGEDKNSP